MYPTARKPWIPFWENSVAMPNHILQRGSFDLWGQMTPKENISEQYIDAIMEVAGSIRYNTETLGTAR